MPVNDELGKRMKEFYENIPKSKLMRRTPVAIRIDGKAFHTFTRGFDKPFDEVLIKSMQETTKKKEFYGKTRKEIKEKIIAEIEVV